MRDIIKEMGYQMPEGFPGLQVFLPADMAIASIYPGVTIQAVFRFPFRQMTHSR